MRPKTCGECEHFQKVEVYKFSGICKLQIKPGIGEVSRLLLGTCPPPGDDCPLPAEPKRTETFEAWMKKEHNGILFIATTPEAARFLGYYEHPRAVRVRVTVEEIE